MEKWKKETWGGSSFLFFSCLPVWSSPTLLHALDGPACPLVTLSCLLSCLGHCLEHGEWLQLAGPCRQTLLNIVVDGRAQFLNTKRQTVRTRQQLLSFKMRQLCDGKMEPYSEPLSFEVRLSLAPQLPLHIHTNEKSYHHAILPVIHQASSQAIQVWHPIAEEEDEKDEKKEEKKTRGKIQKEIFKFNHKKILHCTIHQAIHSVSIV